MFVEIRHGIASHYLINEAGQVYNAKTKRMLKGSDARSSYKLLSEDGQRRTISKRKLMEMVFGTILITDNVERLPGEIFVVIPGTEGKYLISNEGRLLSYQRNEAFLM